ncbi:hypothetical protein ACFE04_029818 [Oxalis oulophora]
MSPPVAFEIFQSPPLSTEPSPSPSPAAPFQNPNNSFTDFTNSSQNQNAAATPRFAASAAAGRTKPRLVKLRKSQQQSRIGSKEKETDFNPFKSGSGQVNDNRSSFVFGANYVQSEVEVSEINVVIGDKKEKSESNVGIGDKNKGNVGFVFGADNNDKSEVKINESGENVVNGTNASFVFGSSWVNSGLGMSSEKREKFADNGTWKKKDYGDTVFVFGSGSKKRPDETPSSNVVEDISINLHSNSTASVFKLPDEMNKLNINDSGCVNGLDLINDSYKDDSGNDENIFVLGGSEKVSNGYTINQNKAAEANGFSETSTSERLTFQAGCKVEVSLKKGAMRGKKLKKVGRKTRQNTLHDQGDATKKRNCYENPNSPGSCSPMDFSPCQETTATDQFSVSEKDESCFVEEPASTSFIPENETASSNFMPEEIRDTRVSDIPFTEYGHRLNSEKQESTCKVHFGAAKTSLSEESKRSEAGEQLKQKVTSPDNELQEVCETWRLRGNQAYKNDNLTLAEQYYTQGINAVPSSDLTGAWVKPLVFCYSNRAATRISLGRIREALEDCITATKLDPSFLKVYVRAANLISSGYNGKQYFDKCLESSGVVCLDRRIMIDAAEGLRKAKRVAECINSSAKLLDQKTSDGAASALEKITEALSTSSRSEKLLQMKAEALCMLQKYNKAIQLCEQTLEFAEKNFYSSATDNQSANIKGSENFSIVKLWRWHSMSKSYFYMGKFDVALELLQKIEQTGSMQEKNEQEILESSKSLASTIHELLRRKLPDYEADLLEKPISNKPTRVTFIINAGNEAVQSGKYTEALEQYTAAVSNNVESRPFAAICFCNRAAAHQALGQIGDAIADCSLAMALDKTYKKAVSRRAALHEMIRDYEHASSDLRRLISIIKSQPDEKSKQSSTPSRTPVTKELKQAQRQLSLMEEEAKKGTPLDLYLILGVKQSDTAAEIKKAYRKAALRHHPDKVLARSECVDAGRLCKEISEELHMDADRLFKMIGEAYAVLSDTSKNLRDPNGVLQRSEYDGEEELRKAAKESNGRSPYSNSRRPTEDDYQYYSNARTQSRRYWQESWKPYGNNGFSSSRW